MEKRITHLLLPLLLGAAACSAEDVGEENRASITENLDLPNEGGRVRVLGEAVDSASQRFLTSSCVETTGAPEVDTSGRGLLVFDKSMSQEELDTMFGMESSVKARYGAVNGSARAAFTRTTESRKTSINVVFGATYNLKTVRFNPTGARVKPGKNLDIGCGDSYLSQMNYGADLAILYRIDFASESDKTAFEASVSANYAGMAQGDASVKAAAAAFRGRASVHVEARQFGGDVSYMAEAIAGADGGLSATECAIDRLDACNRLVAAGIRYASTTFARSAAANPGVRTYVVEDYSTLNLPFSGEVLPDKLVIARDTLSNLYDNELDVRDRVLSLGDGNIQLSTQQRQTLEKVRAQSGTNMRVLRNIVPLCFDKIELDNAATINACAAAVKKPALKTKGFIAQDVSDLDFPHVGNVIKRPNGTVIRRDFWNNITLGQGDWGTWRDWEYCPNNQYAIGYHMRVEQRLGNGDDTGLNAVTLHCGELDHRMSATPVTIDSYPGLWGDQHPTRFCTNGVVRGGKMKIEDNASDNDDTAANDVRLMCSDGIEIRAPGGGDWGDWIDGSGRENDPSRVAPVLCDPGTAVCGIRSRFEKSQGRGDDTAMNGLAFACCSF